MTKSHLTTYIRVKITLILITIVVFASFSQSSVGIGTVAPHQSAILDVYSTNKGLLPPRMSKDQMDAIISPAEGLMIYCSGCTPNGVYIYNNRKFRLLQFFENPVKYLNIADVSVPKGTPSFDISPTLIPSGATVGYELVRKPTGVTMTGTTVSISEDMNVGEYSITVEAIGTGEYNGETKATFKLYIIGIGIALTGFSIADVSVIKGTTSFDIPLTLTPSGATVDYELITNLTEVTMAGTTINIVANMDMGEYNITVKATGNGDYNGEIRATFKLSKWTSASCFNFYSGSITDYTCTDTNVVILASIGGVAVSHIGNNAFKNKRLSSVTIPNSVTSIGRYAFNGNQLTSVIIPNSVTSIGHASFARNDLSSVTIGNSVENISPWAFAYNNLTSVYISYTVTSIGNRAFAFNPLRSVSINRGTTYKSSLFGDDCTVGNGCIRIR